MRFQLMVAMLLAASAAPVFAQNVVGVYGTPQIPANSVAQGRTDYTAFAFAPVQVLGSTPISFTACTIANANTTNPAVTADTVRIRLVRDAYPFNLSIDAGDTIVATVNNPSFPVVFSGFNETLPTLSTLPSPWPYFVAIDVAGVGTSTVGRIYQLSLTSIVTTGILSPTTPLPITGNDQTIAAPSTAEMDVQRNSLSIAAGSQDDTGNRLAGTPFTLTYTILNTGSTALNLTGSPLVEIITLSIVNCAANVALQPTTPVPATTGSTTFQVSITPTTSGQPFGLGFIINNNDSDENPYNIVVIGDAVASVPAATQLVITTQPGNGTAGGTLSAQPVLEARDGSGNVDTNYTANVTATITSGTGTSGAAILGTAMVAASGGVAVFTNLGIDLAGTGYTLTFTSGALPQAVSNTFNITGGGPGPADRLFIATQPGGAAPSAAFSPQPVVEVHDASGVLVPQNGTTVSAAIVSGPVTALFVGANVVNVVNGVAAFTNLGIDTAGTYTIEFTHSGGLTPATSAAVIVSTGGGGGGGGGSGGSDGGGCVAAGSTMPLALLALLAWSRRRRRTA
ncbi:MAG: hypothetical protein IT464_10890 [Planctomycetes bacterium]|nr:hypothetical protein [Planctomycetota bacterium]